jgi:hypothetical protein
MPVQPFVGRERKGALLPLVGRRLLSSLPAASAMVDEGARPASNRRSGRRSTR